MPGLLQWELKKDGREVRVRAGGPLVVNDCGLALPPVRAGAGLGRGRHRAREACLGARRLVSALSGLHLYHFGRRQLSPALRALIAAHRR